jgi:hypothetical protein
VTDEGLPLLLRGLNRYRGPSGDIPYITNSWLTNAQKRSRVFAGISPNTFFKHHHRILEIVIPRATTLVACDPENPSVIYGWMCAEILDGNLTVHYSYVKDAFKFKREERAGFGVGKELLLAFTEAEENSGRPVERLVHTHDTHSWQGFIRHIQDSRAIPSLQTVAYNPYALYSSLPTGWAS